MSKSTGQIIGTVVGGIVGAFAGGNIALGATIGGMVGGYLDPPKIKGNPPSAESLRMQTSAYGVPLGRGYGTYGRYGNVFWIEGNTLRSVEVEGEGGKGGAPAAPSYQILGTFAIGFGEGEIDYFRRIWVSGKLIYDADAVSLEGIVASNEASGSISFYTGSSTQIPDDRIQADLGAANTPAWRGLHYIVLKDWPMGDFGNTLAGAQVKAEIVTNSTPTGMTLLEEKTIAVGSGDQPKIAANGIVNDNYDVFAFVDPEFSIAGLPATGVYRQHVSGLLAETRTTSFESPSNNGGSISNSSPEFIGCITRDGSRYLVNGAEYIADRGWVLFNTDVWVADGCFIGVAEKADAAQAPHLVRLRPDGSIEHSYIEAYDVTDTVFTTFIAGGYIWVISYGTTYKFDYDTLTKLSAEANSFTSPDAIGSWCVSEGDDGKVYRGLDANSANIRSLNSTMTGYGAEVWSVSYAIGAVVRGGLLYTARRDVPNNQIVMAVYRLAGHAPQPVALADIIEAECLSSGVLESADIDTSEIADVVRGYAVADLTSIRNALTPLQSAFPFDVIPSGYQIKFVPRGKAPVATVEYTDLGTVAGNEKPGVRITSSREMDTQLPRRVQVKFIDAEREYDVGVGPGAERQNTDAVNVAEIDLGIVMTATEAAGIEEMLLNLYWMERNDVSFVLPPTFVALEAADVITVNGDGATYQLRLTEVNYLPDGRLECKAKYNAAVLYTPVAVAQGGINTGQVLSLAGGTLAILLDIPVLLDAQDGPGFAVAMTGYLSGWKGGTLYRTDDNGGTWTPLAGCNAPGAVIGQLVSAFPAGRTDIIDTAAFPAVHFLSGTPSSVSELQMLNGANHFAIGAPGRWEIVGVQNWFYYSVDGNYYPYNLLRGRFGSEWAMGSAQIGDYVVALDSNRLKFVPANLNTIGSAKTYRAVTNGRAIDSSADMSFTYAGENLECLAPVYLNGSRHPSTNDWTLTWVRRTRVGGEWRDWVDTSLGESSESYEIEVYASGTYATIKRTMASSSPSIVYSSALQVTDFGSNQSTLYLKIYQISASVGRGHALTVTITR